MNPTRKMKQEDLDRTLEYQNRQQGLLAKELMEEKLSQLQAFIDQLAHTPHGRAELQVRTERFGACKRLAGETTGQFYGKLRHWLDRT